MLRRRLVRYSLATSLVLIALAFGASAWLRSQVTSSLAQLDGEIIAKEIAAPTTAERDELGIPTIKASNRTDLAFATGYLHAQDRYFQMDLLRRNSAGELAELVGAAALPLDRRHRIHQFRKRAKKVLDAASTEDRQVVESYTKGVNAGLAALSKPPFEYLLLRQSPKPWQAEDGLLVQFSMFVDLQLILQTHELALALLSDTRPGPVFEFLAHRGTEWDAALDGSRLPEPPIPGPEVFDMRQETAGRQRVAQVNQPFPEEPVHLGSNNWAISGKRSKHGGAIVCDDMHLRFGVPHIWYRASFEWNDDKGSAHKATGVTLPGTPAIIVGSNGRIAWGFTNSEADWSDLVIVEVDPNDPTRYRTPTGWQAFEKIVAPIVVKDGPEESLAIQQTIWGPVVARDGKGRPLAHRWVAHDPEGVNLLFARMEGMQTLEAALDLANRSGIPGQNFVVGDRQGRIAWTIAGRLPRRRGHDGRLPTSWADGSNGWDGYLNVDEYPRIVDPESGQIWTANSRVVGGEALAKLGFGHYDLGARSKQIRDGLTAIDKGTEADMLKIQLDDRALFLERWQRLLLTTLKSWKSDEPRLRETIRHVENWGAQASVRSVGYRLVRDFRLRVVDLVMRPLTAPCSEHDPNFHHFRLGQTEGPVWRLLNERPIHLLDSRHRDWEDLLKSAAAGLMQNAFAGRETLDRYTHGEENRLIARHPMSQAVAGLGTLLALDMKSDPFPGDSNNLPRIQSSTHGASQRMAVSPGREKSGYMHMPCGQSGNPLSPHYRDMHGAWARGEASPFLPGKAIHVLRFVPTNR